MHLLVLSEDFYPTISGGAHAQWRFAQLAAERGHKVTVFTKRLPNTASVECVDGVEIRRPLRAQPSTLPPNHPLAFVTRICFSMYLLVALARWQRRQDADVVISVSQLFHWVAFVLSSIAGLKHVSFVGYTPSLKSRFQIRPDFLLERLNFALFVGDIVFCRAARVRSLLNRHNSEAHVIHGVVNRRRIESADVTDIPDFEWGRFTEDDGEVLAFVGRLTPLKRPVAALDVLQHLPERFRLLFVGDGPLREELHQEIRSRGLTDRAHCLGERPHRQTLATIATADGVLLTSKAEAYPTIVFEALSLCTPVFATSVGILPSVDERRLHLGTTEELPSLVAQNVGQSRQAVDNEVLDQYSMDTYAETMLDFLHERHD